MGRYCIQIFPRFGRYFFDSYRMFLTATEFYRQLPKFDRKPATGTDFSRRKTSVFFRSYLRTGVSCIGTSPPPSSPLTPRSSSPIWPGRPLPRARNDRILPIQSPNFVDRITEFCRQNHRISPTAIEFRQQLPNSSDRITNFADRQRQLPNFADRITEFRQQLLNFADRITEFRRQLQNFADKITEF